MRPPNKRQEGLSENPISKPQESLAFQRASLLGEKPAICEKPKSIAPVKSDAELGLIAFPDLDSSSDDFLLDIESKTVPAPSVPTPKPNILACVSNSFKRKAESGRSDAQKKIKLALCGDSQGDPIQLFVQQQAHFQELQQQAFILQAKQQNEFQKMMMKILQSTRNIHE